jgi:hypothetical protein
VLDLAATLLYSDAALVLLRSATSTEGSTMGGYQLSRIFSVQELRALDLKDIEILKATITNVLRSDEEIRSILERRLREVYNSLRDRR